MRPKRLLEALKKGEICIETFDNLRDEYNRSLHLIGEERKC